MKKKSTNFFSDWPSKYPDCAVSDVHQQSPVDIEPKFIKDLSIELFYNQLYGSNMSFIAINTGHGRKSCAKMSLEHVIRSLL